MIVLDKVNKFYGDYHALVDITERVEKNEVLVVCDGDQLSTCCGGCRQKLREFAPLETMIHVAGEEGVRRTFTLDELLPFSFGPENLLQP